MHHHCIVKSCQDHKIILGEGDEDRHFINPERTRPKLTIGEWSTKSNFDSGKRVDFGNKTKLTVGYTQGEEGGRYSPLASLSSVTIMIIARFHTAIKLHVSVILLAVLAIVTNSQLLFTLDQYEHPSCDPVNVPQTIHVTPHLLNDFSSPLLVFTSPFNLEVLPHQWPSNSKHIPLVLLDPDKFHLQHHQEALFTLLRQSHVHALHTHASSPTSDRNTEEDSKFPSSFHDQILTELAVFETQTGYILPFLTNSFSTLSTELNLSQLDNNNSLPLFHLDLTNNSMIQKPFILQNQQALDFILQSSSQYNNSTSILDMLTPLHLQCLLFRLHCETIAPTDLIFNFCLSIVRRIPSHSIHTDFIPLSTYKTASTSKTGTSFETMRSVVAETVNLARNQDASEQIIRTRLFHPHYQPAEKQVTLSTTTTITFSMSVRAVFLQWFPTFCQVVGTCLLCVSILDIWLDRQNVYRSVCKWLSNCRTVGQAQFISRTLVDRAKLV